MNFDTEHDMYIQLLIKSENETWGKKYKSSEIIKQTTLGINLKTKYPEKLRGLSCYCNRFGEFSIRCCHCYSIVRPTLYYMIVRGICGPTICDWCPIVCFWIYW